MITTRKGLMALIQETLQNAMVARGLNDVDVRQAFQPTKQGTPTNPALLFQVIASGRFGFPKYSDVPDGTGGINHTERQAWESTFQFGTLWPQDPADDVGFTAFDLLDVASRVMQSAGTIAAFLAQGVGIQRVTAIREPKFSDDLDNFEDSPLFDLTLSYSLTETVSAPGTNLVEPALFPV